jgi:hypothetical protein
VHRAGPKSAGRIDDAIVHAHFWTRRRHLGDQAQSAGPGVKAVPAGAGRDDDRAILIERQRPGHDVETEAGQPPARHMLAAQRHALDIDPPQRSRAGIPKRALADPVAPVVEHGDFRGAGHAVSPGSAPATIAS